MEEIFSEPENLSNTMGNEENFIAFPVELFGNEYMRIMQRSEIEAIKPVDADQNYDNLLTQFTNTSEMIQFLLADEKNTNIKSAKKLS